MSESEEIVGASRPDRKNKNGKVVPTVERLHECFTYCPETGLIRWKTPRKKIKVGDIAGTICTNGYWALTLDYARLLAHRVAWAMMTGEWPTKTIDHIDNVRLNNRWDNLQEATYSQNNARTGIRSTNTSGFKGVTYNKPNRKWIASIGFSGKAEYLGSFETPEEAAIAYLEAAIRIHVEFSSF